MHNIKEVNPLRDFNSKNVGAGLVTALLAIVSLPAILIEAATNGGYSNEQTILWLFSIYLFGGIFSIAIPLYYKIPIVGANTITGLAFLTTITPQFTYKELLGAYLFSGIIMLVIGITGAFSKLIAYVPKEIISAMLAGMITKYMVTFVVSLQDLPLIGIVSVIVFFACAIWIKRLPPMLVAIATASLLFYFTEPFVLDEVTGFFLLPTIQMPAFNLVSLVTVSIPLALLILSNDAAVGIGALQKNNFRTPVNQLISLSGIFTIFTSLFGGNSSNVAGMMSAICSDEEAGPKEKRYMAVVIIGIILIAFGVMSWKLVPFIQALPSSFVSMLVGFALLGVFSNSLNTSFSNPKLKISAAFTFIIAMSNVTIFSISAPVWALAVGTFIVKCIEDPAAGK